MVPAGAPKEAGKPREAPAAAGALKQAPVAPCGGVLSESKLLHWRCRASVEARLSACLRSAWGAQCRGARMGHLAVTDAWMYGCMDGEFYNFKGARCDAAAVKAHIMCIRACTKRKTPCTGSDENHKSHRDQWVVRQRLAWLPSLGPPHRTSIWLVRVLEDRAAGTRSGPRPACAPAHALSFVAPV